MKKIILTFTLVIFLSAFASAQDYNTGVGLRLGFSNGLTVKHFVSQRSAFEGILSTRWRGFELTGLYEVHNNAFDVTRLNWYCLLYTSDAADDLLCVDLGGRRIIKKKTKK